MRHCLRCGYPENHPLNIIFDDQGVCSGCRVHEEKDILDWDERGGKLAALFDIFRSETGDNYDCVVPVSGARDSYFIVHTVKKVYGMNPLLVSYNRQFNTERGIRNLSYLRTLLNCDHIQMMISPETVKRITRETIRRLASIYWHVLAGQTVFPVQTAVRYKIPLIVWGVHQGIDQVGMFSHTDEAEMTRKYRFEHDLMGLEAVDLVGGPEGLTEDEMLPLAYPHNREISEVGVRGIYLGNYIRWDSKAQHEAMLNLYAYETAEQARTFDTYNDVDCQHYSGLHDHIKFLKWGYGKALDHAAREIRLRRMTREEAIEKISEYQDVAAPDRGRFLEWVGMKDKDFDACIDEFRDPRAWSKNPKGKWTLRDSLADHRDDPGADEVALGKVEDCEFRITPNKDPGADETKNKILSKGFVPENHSS